MKRILVFVQAWALAIALAGALALLYPFTRFRRRLYAEKDPSGRRCHELLPDPAEGRLRSDARHHQGRRVLIPVDGSDCSLRAVDYLIAARGQREVPDDVEVHLLNVQVALRGDIGQFISPDQIASYQGEESEKALREAQSRLTAAGVRPVPHTGVGHAADVITQTAGELGCDHIVMGTRGRGALADLLAGSTTVRVVHHARMPVVLVK